MARHCANPNATLLFPALIPSSHHCIGNSYLVPNIRYVCVHAVLCAYCQAPRTLSSTDAALVFIKNVIAQASRELQGISKECPAPNLHPPCGHSLGLNYYPILDFHSKGGHISRTSETSRGELNPSNPSRRH